MKKQISYMSLLSAFACVCFPISAMGNPFSQFMGTWTLKDDNFNQIWDGKTLQSIKIPKHITVCEEVNTDKSLLCVVDAGELKGHILWVLHSESNTVHHLSHFGKNRTGVGVGSFEENDFVSTVSFEGEAKGTYRRYEYRWKSETEYTMLSTQYDKNGNATGNWYGGTFIKLELQ